MFTENCKECSDIQAFETALDARALVLVDKAKAFCRPTTKRNNRRWRWFAWWCRLPVVGDWILHYFKAPFRLEPGPEYYYETRYRAEGAAIDSEAQQLERMKGNHLAHWGDEVVSPGDSSDPAGYFTPNYAPRSACYERNIPAFVPKKYDFHSGAGVDKFHTENLVLCSSTKRLVPLSECDFTWTAGVGTVYHWRGPAVSAGANPFAAITTGFQ